MLLTFCATTALLTVSYAQPSGEGKRTPPPEAIEACQGQEDGTECLMTTPRGDTLTGTCQNTPDNKYFACKPKRGPKAERPDKD